MTPDRLRQLADAATPWPWRQGKDRHDETPYQVRVDRLPVASTYRADAVGEAQEGRRVSDLLRVYLDPAEIRDDGYPHAWHHGSNLLPGKPFPPIKDYVRALAGDRCERCGHPYLKGFHGRGEWSPCDDRCTHGGPVRYQGGEVGLGAWEHYDGPDVTVCEYVEARWRILTVHHLNGVKHDCRWWNLAALCQRCHLTIQGRVTMERSYFGEHTEWFKPHAAGFYASHYLSLDLNRAETLARLDELLALEHRQLTLVPAPSEAGDPQPKETTPWSPPAA